MEANPQTPTPIVEETPTPAEKNESTEPNVFEQPAKSDASSSDDSSSSSDETGDEQPPKPKIEFKDIPDSEKTFVALEGAAGVEKWVEKAGSLDFEDLQKEDSLWKGHKRNLVTEFMFRLRLDEKEQGEEEVSWDREDPEEFVVYNRELKEGQKPNEK